MRTVIPLLTGVMQLAQVRPVHLSRPFLINVSQPQLVEREALHEALASGRLGGCGLDTSYEEPGDTTDPLLKFRNVIITPHLGGSPPQNWLDDIEELMVNLARELN